jgi:hypothetical protein
MYKTPFFNFEYIYNQIYLFFTDDHSRTWLLVKRIGLVIFIILIIAIPFLVFGIVRLSRAISALSARDEEDKSPETPEKEIKNLRWEKLVVRLNTDSEAEWKLAIIEADAMLDDLVRGVYPHAGDNLGERLKNIEPSDFTTLQDAWDAHKTRNNIAHDSNARLSEREAKAAMEAYRRVFEEFHFI